MPFPWVTITELEKDVMHNPEWLEYADEHLGRLFEEGRVNKRRYTSVEEMPNGNRRWLRRWATKEDAENWIEFAKGFKAGGFVSGSVLYLPESTQ